VTLRTGGLSESASCGRLPSDSYAEQTTHKSLVAEHPVQPVSEKQPLPSLSATHDKLQPAMNVMVWQAGTSDQSLSDSSTKFKQNQAVIGLMSHCATVDNPESESSQSGTASESELDDDLCDSDFDPYATSNCMTSSSSESDGDMPLPAGRKPSNSSLSVAGKSSKSHSSDKQGVRKESQKFIKLHNVRNTDDVPDDESPELLAINPDADDNVNDSASNSSDTESDSLQSQNGQHRKRTKSKITVAMYSRDKLAFCFDCGTAQTQIQRHWKQHKESKDVCHLMNCSDETERQRLICRLRNLGNHLHNTEVLRQGHGTLVVIYCRSKKANPYDYVPCELCLGYLLKKDLWRHKCKLGKQRKGRCNIQNAEMLLPPPHGVSHKVSSLISSMRDDEIKAAIKSDPTIMEYLLKMVHSKGMQKKHYIRDKGREMGRFLLEMRKHNGLKGCSIKDCIRPIRFSTCLVAVRVLAGYDEDAGFFRRPSLALKIGQGLKKLSQILKRHAIESQQYEKIADVSYFHDLCVEQWPDEIARHAHNSLREIKRNRVNLLPITSDVQKLVSYLRDSSQQCIDKLDNSGSLSKNEVAVTYRELVEVTLADIITFNRRRQGEVSRMTIQDYCAKTRVNPSVDTEFSLSPMEQSLCKMFSRVELRGKRDRTVPVLLTVQAETAIDTIILNRSEAGVRSDNNYVFALSHSENYVRGCDALRNAAGQCSPQHASSLTSTNFRKHIATISQVLNLKENELDVLAQFMGHDIRVHRNFYRLPNDVVQTSQLAKIFLLMDSGQLTKSKGMTLEDLLVSTADNSGTVGKFLLTQKISTTAHVIKLYMLHI